MTTAAVSQDVSNLFAAFKAFQKAKDVPTFTKITGLKMDGQSIKNANGVLLQVWGSVNHFNDYVRHSRTDAKLALQKLAKASGATTAPKTAAPTAPTAAPTAPKTAAPTAAPKTAAPTAAPKAAPTKGKAAAPTAAAEQSDVLREILENQATEILMQSGLDFDQIVRERALKILTDSGFNFEEMIREEAKKLLQTKIGL